MESEWKTVTLRDFVDLRTGFPFQSKLFSNSPQDSKLLRGDNIAQGTTRWDNARYWCRKPNDGLDEYELKVNDVILAMDRPWIEAGLKRASIREGDIPSLLVQRVARLRGTKQLDTCFLRYLIETSSFTEHILSVQTGTSIPHISSAQILDFKFKLPPFQVQLSIAKVLRALDDKIELNRQMNATLDQMARALFKSWFIDFDPVHAKAVGKQPPLMSSTLTKPFPDQFNKEGLPVGWRVGRLDDLAVITMGTSPASSTYNDLAEGTPLVNGPAEYGDVFPLRVKWTTAPTRMCCANDLIFCVRGSTTGRRVISDGEYCLGRGVCAISARRLQTYVNWHIDFTLEELLSKCNGSTFPNLNGPEIKSHATLIPTSAVLDSFAELTVPWQNQLVDNSAQNIVLTRTRDALLPQLLSGKIRLRHADKIVEDALA